MATTTNYGWATPDDTALVKDGAAAIRSLGTSVDTTTKALNPSTTLGDIEYRSSTPNTNTRLPLGTAGQVLKVNSGATAPEWATDATGMTNPLTTTGDTIYSSSGTTPARLGIGSTGQVLTVASGIPSWATPASSSGPAFRAYRATTSQALTSATYTKIAFNAETFDTDNCFDSTTNYRFTPTKAGYYQLDGSIYFISTAQSQRKAVAALYINGSVATYFANSETSGTVFGCSFGQVYYFNGSTDYAELYGYLDATTPLAFTDSTTFSGIWIRS
jgi:hypothetical protein